MIKYDRLKKLLQDNGYNYTRIRKEGLLSEATLTRLRNHTGGLSHATIDKLCATFQCQPNDLMEYVPDKPKEETI